MCRNRLSSERYPAARFTVSVIAVYPTPKCSPISGSCISPFCSWCKCTYPSAAGSAFGRMKNDQMKLSAAAWLSFLLLLLYPSTSSAAAPAASHRCALVRPSSGTSPHTLHCPDISRIEAPTMGLPAPIYTQTVRHKISCGYPRSTPVPPLWLTTAHRLPCLHMPGRCSTDTPPAPPRSPPVPDCRVCRSTSR